MASNSEAPARKIQSASVPQPKYTSHVEASHLLWRRKERGPPNRRLGSNPRGEEGPASYL